MTVQVISVTVEFNLKYLYEMSCNEIVILLRNGGDIVLAWIICEIMIFTQQLFECFSYCFPVTDGRVVRAGVSVTSNVHESKCTVIGHDLEHHEFEPWSGRTWGV